MEQITLNREFIAFIKSLLKINDSAILIAGEDSLSCLIGTPDNVAIAYGVFPCTNTYKGFLNISSIIKLTKALDQIEGDSITLNVNSNNIEYKSPSLRFKYHLLDNGIISQPKINLKKIAEFEFDVSFNLDTAKLVGLNKFSAFCTDSNKVYLEGKDGKVFAELTDKSKSNIDSLQFEFTDSESTFAQIPLNLDFFRSLSYNNTSMVTFNINTTRGIVAIDIATSSYKLKYITSAFTS